MAAGFGTRVVYLALLPRLGELGATAAVGGGYLLIALIFGVLALREPASPELKALDLMEAEAKQKAVLAVNGLGMRADGLTRSVSSAFTQKNGQAAATKLAGLGSALPVAAAARAMDLH